MPNDDFLEQVFENFNRDNVSNENPLGGDKNSEEEEQKTMKETESYENFNHNFAALIFCLV